MFLFCSPKMKCGQNYILNDSHLGSPLMWIHVKFDQRAVSFGEKKKTEKAKTYF